MNYVSNAFAFLLLVGLVTSCDYDRITGTGNVTVEERDLDDFTAVETNDVININVTKGFEYSVRVHANENIQDRLITEVKNGQLEIYLENGNYKDITTEVVIIVPELEKVTIRDAASGVISGLNGGDIHFDVHDSGDLEVWGIVDKLQLEVHDAGNFEGFGLETKHCAMLIKDAADVNINVQNYLEGIISDAGDVRYKGDPAIDVEIRDAGDLEQVD